MDDAVHVQWRKATRSGGNAACDGAHAVRDSKDPSGPALVVTAAGWSAFTAGVRAGEFG
jgi:hypothetical protein